MYNSMIFPATVDEFMEEYKVVDSEHVYSNGMEMVPIFRMKQWFEHEANHDAELGKMVDDTVSRQAAIDAAKHAWAKGLEPSQYIELLPPVQPDIIRCRNCKFASGDSRICMQFGHSPIGELDFCAWAERRTDEE